MNKKLKSILLSVTTIISATAIVVAVVSAGSLNPTAGPGSTMYTMEEIHNRLLNGDTTAIENDHDFDPSADPTTGTMHTLKDIYDLIPPANQVLSTYTPTGGTPWGTATPAPAQVVWQTPDPAQDLCWDGNQGCAIGNGAIQPLPDTNPSLRFGAMEYCQYLKPDGIYLNCDGTSCTVPDPQYWHLPKLSELMVALSNSWISDGTGLPGGFRDGVDYWSSLPYSGPAVWFAYGDSDSNVYNDRASKGNQFAVRCAH